MVEIFCLYFVNILIFDQKINLFVQKSETNKEFLYIWFN